jgi:hypothetical protein
VFRSLCLLLSFMGFMCAATAMGAPPEDAVKERMKALLEVARKGLAEAESDTGGGVAYTDIWLWSNRVLKAELALSTTKSQRIAALEAHLRRALKLEQFARREYDRGGFPHLSLLEAIYRRYDVELQLTQERAKPEPTSR